MIIGPFDNEYDFLSNFYPCTIEYLGHEFPSVEHAYQASKALYPYDIIRIRDAETPAKAKKLGRKIQIKPEWPEHKLEVMKNLLRKKFNGDALLGRKLLETGDAELVEFNWWNDTFWGVCKGSGENHLGKLLVEIREELKCSQLKTC